MLIVGIDFAPRFSAGVILRDTELLYSSALDVGPESDGFSVHVQRLTQWLEEFSAVLSTHKQPDERVEFVVEDVTHMMTKPAQVLRLQGAFRLMLYQRGVQPTMVLPGVWQKWYGWKKTPGTTSKGFARYACALLGYVDLGTKGKATTDVRDAILISRWLYETDKCVSSGASA